MSQSIPVQRTNWVLIGIFVAALLTHAWCATRNWTTPFMPGHEFRQTQTALISSYIDQQDNFSLLYETPIVGKPWVSVLMEVPIYEWSVVGLSRWWHVPLQVAARTITLGCFYLMLPALYLLLGRLGLVPARRLLALALVLVCPLYIFYSRAFLMDSMALMFSAWFLFGFVRMMDRRRWYWFVLAAAAGTGAALVKSAVLAIWLWPAAAYGAWLLWPEVRARAWKAALETVFWGVAGVIVPLGFLRGWILLTDPIKELHASAWIFTSKNLAEGNWGLTNLAARFSLETWSVLAERWREGIMPPWLLLALLAAGLLALPRVRWPALGWAGMFFLAQLLFPFAYAYQDYYFYACALFLGVSFAWLFFGLLDSRAPRWLCWLLLAVPVFAQLHTYRENYYPGQIAQSEGGFPFTRALRDFLPKDSVIVVAGGDWSAIIPYYTQRKALMIRNGLENDATYLDRAFADLADETVGALVLVDAQRGNRALVERTAAAFGTDRQPSFSSDRAEIYCNLLYRDRLKEDLRNAGNYDGLKNETSAPAPAATTQPFRISSGLARTSFPGISPAPIRAHFEFGLGYIWIEERKVIFAHPHTNLWIPAPSQTKQITWDFGIVSGAYEGKEGKTDGVEFTLMGIRPGGEYRVVFRRILEPATQAADRGTQHEVISYETIPGEILEFSTSPGQGRSFDWAYWAKIEVK